MDNNDMWRIIFMVVAILLCFGIDAIVRLVVSTFTNKQIKNQPQLTEHHNDIVNNTKNIIAYIKETCELVAELKYIEFADTYDVFVVSRETLKKLATDAAKCVHSYIDLNNIDFGDTITNKEYINYIIVNYTFTLIKHMYDKDVGE